MLDFLLCESVDGMKRACTCTTRLRSIVCKVTWLATVVTRIIQSFPVLTQDQSYIVLCSSFMLVKGESNALFVLDLSSTPAIFIG